MKTFITKCDICGIESDDIKTYRTLIFRTFDANDGKSYYYTPSIAEREIDLCGTCARKCSNIQDIGVMEKKYILRSNPELTNNKDN